MRNLALLLASAALAHRCLAFSATSPSRAYTLINDSTSLKDPRTNEPASNLLERGSDDKKKKLVVLLPQLGEFDSAEYTEFLVAAKDSLDEAGIDLKVVGIGGGGAAANFCEFTGLDGDRLVVDETGELHRQLELHAGPGFEISDDVSDGVIEFFLRQLPGGIPSDASQLRPVGTAWWVNNYSAARLVFRVSCCLTFQLKQRKPTFFPRLNYMAMCAGIGAPGTLREILRGYFGDKAAPERFRDDDVVEAGPITIGPGVGPTSIGPLKYNQWFSDEKGYQRPVELATVRLKNMVEVLTKWDEYVSDPTAIPLRGATYLFDEDGTELYAYKSRGVLTYSETMPRPLTFLSDYIGEETARNPLGLADNGGGDLVRGRGVLKPAGKLMGLLSFPFRLENRLQAAVLGATESDYDEARRDIEETTAGNGVVVYTYGLSPFSSEALAVLDEAGADYENVEVGLEWFLLGRERSALRAQLLEVTGQSSLPQVFIDGE